jgi:hypothetical protein
MEITRVTFENYLKKYEKSALLNSITNTEAVYIKDSGVEIKVEAPNAEVFMNNQSNRFEIGDSEMIDTFYTNEIIALQQKRLEKAVASFLLEFRSYLPKLSTNESFFIVFNIADAKRSINGKEIEPSPQSGKRAYQLVTKIKMADLNAIVNGEIDENQFSQRILTEKK